MVGCYGKLDGSPGLVHAGVLIDQSELYTTVLVPAQQDGVDLCRIQVNTNITSWCRLFQHRFCMSFFSVYV